MTAPPVPQVSPIKGDPQKDNIAITYSKTIVGNSDKVKKYATLQFRIENDKVNQKFGFYELTKYFTVGNYGR